MKIVIVDDDCLVTEALKTCPNTVCPEYTALNAGKMLA